MVAHEISTYLKPARQVHRFARVATTRRYPSSPQGRPEVRSQLHLALKTAPQRSPFQLVSHQALKLDTSQPRHQLVRPSKLISLQVKLISRLSD